MGRKLASMGVRSCGDLQQVTLSQLQKKFGPRTGQTLFRFCRGLDDRPVRYEKERKSVSAEMNYNIRFTKVRPTFFLLCHLFFLILFAFPNPLVPPTSVTRLMRQSVS